MKSKRNQVEYDDKVDCLKEIHTLENQGYIDLVYGDESGFSLNCVVSACWQFPGEPVEILPQRGKTLNTLGFMNSTGNQVHIFSKEGSINSDFVIKSINSWVETLSKMTVLVLDNARIHHSTLFKDAMDKWEEKGLYIFFLPSYSPHLNRIELLWRQTKYRWVKPQDYKDLTTLKEALDKIWQSFGTQYQVKFKDCF